MGDCCMGFTAEHSDSWPGTFFLLLSLTPAPKLVKLDNETKRRWLEISANRGQND